MNKSNLRRYFQLLLIVLAAGSIYPVIYLKTNYQETILQVFGMTLPQLNIIYSILGFVFLIGYFPSGILSDKFSAKKLLAISLFGTAIGGFWFAQVPKYTSVILIFSIWGVFSVFTFWSAQMKLVKLLAKPEEEGRFFGILDGGRGVVEAVLASIAVIIFSNILGSGTDVVDKRSAIIAIIYMYSFVLLVVAVLIAIFVEDDKKAVKQSGVKAEVVKKEKVKLSDFGKVFKNKYVFILGGIIFMSYAVTWTVYYLGGFLQTNIQVDAVKVGQIMVIVLWMRPIGGIVGGFLADKFGKGKTLGGALLLAAVSLILIAIMPVGLSKGLFYLLVIGAGLFIYAIRGTYWSLLGDCKIDNSIVGAAIGFISVLGYLPDILLPIFNNSLFKTFGGNGGYNAYFISSAVFGAIGIVLVVLFTRLTKQASKSVQQGKEAKTL